jgi:hypothetical protein
MPNGVFVRLTREDGRVYLVLDDELLAWTPGGYGEKIPRPSCVEVGVLTPESTVGVLRAGYEPEMHRSTVR